MKWFLYMCVCMCIYIYIYIHTYIHTYRWHNRALHKNTLYRNMKQAISRHGKTYKSIAWNHIVSQQNTMFSISSHHVASHHITPIQSKTRTFYGACRDGAANGRAAVWGWTERRRFGSPKRKCFSCSFQIIFWQKKTEQNNDMKECHLSTMKIKHSTRDMKIKQCTAGRRKSQSQAEPDAGRSISLG